MTETRNTKSRPASNRNWCFTLNNYTEDEILALKQQDQTAYIVWCKEKGKSETPHLQGYLEFKNVRGLKGVKKIPGLERAHLEPRYKNSTKMHAFTYCMKSIATYLLKEEKKRQIIRDNAKAKQEAFIARWGECTCPPETLDNRHLQGQCIHCQAKILELQHAVLTLPDLSDPEEEMAEYTDEELEEGREWISEDPGLRILREKTLLGMPDDYHTNPSNHIITKLCFEKGDWTLNQKKIVASASVRQGKRNDISLVKEMVKAGASLDEIHDATTSYQALQFAKSMLQVRAPTRNWKTKVIWVTGPSGNGKTAWCIKHSKGTPWISSGTLRWFDGYNGQETAIFDDYRYDQRDCSFQDMLTLLDRYPRLVQVKGGFVDWVPRYIFIASVELPTECFRNASSKDGDTSQTQILRRIDFVVNLKNKLVFDTTQEETDVHLEEVRQDGFVDGEVLLTDELPPLDLTESIF